MSFGPLSRDARNQTGLRPDCPSHLRTQFSAVALLAVLAWVMAMPMPAVGQSLLQPNHIFPHVERFNAMEAEPVTNAISNDQSLAWLQKNIPLFECSDSEVEEIYYFRWWSFRTHIVQTPRGFVLTEFLTPVKHAGEFNTIACAAGMHLAEGRWLHDDRYLNDYTQFWLRGRNGKPQPHFHNFSGWFAMAAFDRFLVNADRRFLTRLLPDLAADYRQWETERQLTNGLFWQYDVKDAMEESISGSRTEKNLRPTINSYMFANARAIAAIASLANKHKLAAEFAAKAEALQRGVQASLWDEQAKFFKVRHESGQLSDAREAIGWLPWMFHLPDSNRGYEQAWLQFADPQGFRAPAGLTTAERRHPQFRSHGFGHCEWDGAVWPFATSQTLVALANVLRDYPQTAVTRADYFDALLTYVHSQHAKGKPYIGEYLDEVTGDWINRNDRSAHYNHSTFADLLITGVVGLRPRADDMVEVEPLLPDGVWEWFCLDGVKYHGRVLSIFWDQSGQRYHRGKGLVVLCDGKEIARSENLARISTKLPK